MSFLLSEGHVHAGRYPLRRLWDEVRIASQRVNVGLASQAVLTQLVIGSLFAKESGDVLKKTLEDLTDGG